jgi:hypothetical protein
MSNGKTFSESTGLTLRKITSIVWFFLPLIFFMMLKPAFFQYEDIEIPPVAIEQDNCYIEEYYEYINETTCSLEITFNQRVYEGPVTVVFYDKSGRELETLVIPLVTNDLFGNANYDKILGFLIAANYSGYAVGAPVVNLCFDKFGTYKPVLLVLAAVMLTSMIAFQFIITTAGKDKAKILAAQEAQ